jgi:hypothetical protein
MNLYKISQSINNGYDTFSSAVVAATTLERAKSIHPRGRVWNSAPKDKPLNLDGDFMMGWEFGSRDRFDSEWADHPGDVDVVLIGTATAGTIEGVIVASYHAG